MCVNRSEVGSRAEPGRIEPSRTEPGRIEPIRTEPGRFGYGRVIA
jgi:hypothetical protein